MKKADMSWPIRIWLSIVFAFLLVDNSFAYNASTEVPIQETDNLDNYEVIDLANQQGNREYNANTMTGQTTRYFTNGEVDDDFWLKHLGEDYKNAVHLVVNSKNQYHEEGVYNMTGNEAHLMHNDNGNNNYASFTKENPVEYNDNQQQQQQYTKEPTENNIAVENSRDTNSTDFSTTTTNATSSYNSNETKPLEHANKSNLDNVEQSHYARAYAMEDADAQKYFNSNSYHTHNERHKKHEQTPTQNIDYQTQYNTHTQHTYNTQQHSQTNTDTNNNTNTNPQEDPLTNTEHTSSSKSVNSPIVVNLPIPRKNVYQLDDVNDSPVVLKMPLVIYHSNPTYRQRATLPQRYFTHIQQRTPQIQQYNSNTAHSSHTPQKYQTYYQPYQQYSPSSYHDNNYYRPHAHVLKNYAPPMPYKKLGTFNLSFTPNKKVLEKDNEQDTGTPGLRYFISKASTSKQKADEQLSKDGVPGLTRISRSNQELFEIGL